MALPLPPGLTPSEVAFLCEMELVSVIPRQKMDPIPLLAGPTPTLTPPRTTALPLYLALLLHRQKRANILPPAWLSVPSLEHILRTELDNPDVFSPSPSFPAAPNPSRGNAYASSSHIMGNGHIPSPPFLEHNTATMREEGALPYHWLELGTVLLAQAADSVPPGTAATLSSLLRDIREVRQSKLRAGMKALEGGGVVSLRGVGAMEVAENRAFITTSIGTMRQLGATREAARREREAEEGPPHPAERSGTGRSQTVGRSQTAGMSSWEDEDDDGML